MPILSIIENEIKSKGEFFLKNSAKLRKMVLTALFTALTCVATMVIQIQMPATQGYVNIGDCFVLLGAWVLGPLYGGLAGGLGSALADLLTGYAHYVPGTFIIKALMAVIAALLYQKLGKKHEILGELVGGVAAELWMVLGYFLYAMGLLGKGLAAATSIPGNLLQGAIGLVAAVALSAALRGSNALKETHLNERNE